MAQQWFKFWGGEWLNDQKRLALTPVEQSCWVVLMCYASQSDLSGSVKHLTEERLLVQTGIDINSDSWKETVGILKKLEKLEMITVDNDVITLNNWTKRQERALTPYERVKRYRNKKNDNDDNENDNARVDKNRIEKRREEKPHAHLDYLINIPPEDLKELNEKFEASTSQIKRKGEQFRNYCLSKAKTYRNYRAAIENALDKDFGRRERVQKKFEEVEIPLTPAQKKRIEDTKAEIALIAKGKRVEV